MSLLSLGVGFVAWYINCESWQTLLFSTLVFTQLAVALSVRSESNVLFRLGLFTNRPMVLALLASMVLQMTVVYVPFFQQLLHTKPLSGGELAVVFGVSAAAFVLVELLEKGTLKLAGRKKRGHH